MLTLVPDRASSEEKPQILVRGDSSRHAWAWNGLCFGVPMHQASAEGLRDIASGVSPSVVTGVVYRRDNRGNQVVDWVGVDQNRVEWPTHPRHQTPSTALTVYCRMKAKNVATASGPPGNLLTHTYHPTNDPWMTWGLLTPNGDISQIYGYMATGGAGSYIFIGPFGPMPTTEYISVFFRWLSGTAPRMDILGERGNSLFTFTHGSTITGSLGYSGTGNIRLNASENTFNQIDGIFSQAMVWSRRLNDVEMTSLVSDPFGWFEPRKETVLIAAPFPVIGAPATVTQVGAYANAAAVMSGNVPTDFSVTASPNADSDFTTTVLGVTTTTTVPAGDTQVIPTGATSQDDVTFVGMESPDTGV